MKKCLMCFVALALATTVSATEKKDVTIESALRGANAAAAKQKYAHSLLTQDAFVRWAEEYCRVSIAKEDRDAVRAAIRHGNMPAGWSFEISTDFPGINVQPPNLPLVNGKRIWTYSDYLRSLLAPRDLELTTEPYVKPFPALDEKGLAPAVGVRVTPIQVQGTPLADPPERDSLRVEIEVKPDTVEEIVRYFGFGFDRRVLRENLLAKLSGQPSVWMDLKELIPNWVGKVVSTFPTEKQNEVCHGPAREFYYPDQDARLNKGTETTELLLLGHYRRLDGSFEPVFGDYVYMPGKHSGRYILKDPHSGRGIVFSVQSGGNVPYRFWWLDEDFSSHPFGHKPAPDMIKTAVDFWRRSK